MVIVSGSGNDLEYMRINSRKEEKQHSGSIGRLTSKSLENTPENMRESITRKLGRGNVHFVCEDLNLAVLREGDIG